MTACRECGAPMPSDGSLHTAPECVSVLTRRASEAEARAAVAEAAAEMAIKERVADLARAHAETCEDHGFTAGEHCEHMEAMLRAVPGDFCEGDGDAAWASATAERDARIEVTPELRAAVEACREARARSVEFGPRRRLDPTGCTESRLADIILAALPGGT